MSDAWLYQHADWKLGVCLKMGCLCVRARVGLKLWLHFLSKTLHLFEAALFGQRSLSLRLPVIRTLVGCVVLLLLKTNLYALTTGVYCLIK